MISPKCRCALPPPGSSGPGVLPTAHRPLRICLPHLPLLVWFLPLSRSGPGCCKLQSDFSRRRTLPSLWAFTCSGSATRTACPLPPNPYTDRVSAPPGPLRGLPSRAERSAFLRVPNCRACGLWPPSLSTLTLPHSLNPLQDAKFLEGM